MWFDMFVALLQNTEQGLYCSAGDFYIDPCRGVDYAVVTHAHSDHARPGSRHYLGSETGLGVLRERIGPGAHIESLPYGRRITRNGVTISLHPAGHILGSAQIRMELGGEVWVVSGDYKTESESTCAAFEAVPCHTFVTESTFGLPIYRWRPQSEIFEEINAWWRSNQSSGRTSVLFAYSLGKSQRILSGIDASIGPIFVHGAVSKFLKLYAEAGVKLPEVQPADLESVRAANGKGLVVGPSSADGSPWLHKFGDVSKAFASGWMQLRGSRRRQALDRGFVLSDHADWNGLLASIRATGASRVLVTHGYTGQLARWLRENGWEADALTQLCEDEFDKTPDTEG